MSSETLVCIGGGASLSVADLARVGRAVCAGEAIAIAVNEAIYAAWFARALYAADYKWWQANIQRLSRFDGWRLTSDPSVPKAWASRMIVTGRDGYDPEHGTVRTGNGSGYQALHYAMRWSRRRVLLLGYDMQGPRFHDHYKDEPDCDYASVMLPHFASLVEPAKAANITILNCSPGSALQCFPAARLEDVL